MARTELTIAGVGGQGSILAALVLGSAAVNHDGKYATQTQAYSSELRGGFAAAWIIVSDTPVVYPRVVNPDILVAQAQDSIVRFCPALKRGGILLIDSDMVTEVPKGIEKISAIPATSIARNQLGVPVVANMVILGALCKVGQVVSRQGMEKAIAQAVPKGKERLNLEAFSLGYQLVAPYTPSSSSQGQLQEQINGN